MSEKISDDAISDAALYAKMSVPFQNTQVARDAMRAFANDVAIAREKHKIPDVLYAVRATAEDTDEGLMIVGHRGDSDFCDVMALELLRHACLLQAGYFGLIELYRALPEAERPRLFNQES